VSSFISTTLVNLVYMLKVIHNDQFYHLLCVSHNPEDVLLASSCSVLLAMV
jgi:hypothetical protein